MDEQNHHTTPQPLVEQFERIFAALCRRTLLLPHQAKAKAWGQIHQLMHDFEDDKITPPDFLTQVFAVVERAEGMVN